MNSDYKSKIGEKFKYVFVPIFEEGQFYLYGVTTDLKPCETKNAIIEIVDVYSHKSAEMVSNCIFDSMKLATSDRPTFKCTMAFVCSLGLDGKLPEYTRYYCYEWYDVDTGYIFYVGKGTGNRWKQVKPGRRNDDFVNYYNTHNCSCRFVETDMSEQDAYLAEKDRLKYLHEIGQAHCNHDEGGRCGATNYGHYNGMFQNTHTDSVKKMLSDINKKAQARGKNNSAKAVYVYREDMTYVNKYDCVPDAIDALFPDTIDKKEFSRIQARIYESMRNSKKIINGYYFSREKVC